MRVTITKLGDARYQVSAQHDRAHGGALTTHMCVSADTVRLEVLEQATEHERKQQLVREVKQQSLPV